MEKLIPLSQRTAQDVYLEYVNDWLTIKAIAENYNMEEEAMLSLINKGRREHEESVKAIKMPTLIERQQEALQNAANTVKLTVHLQPQTDKRNKKGYFYCTLYGTSISPVLDYSNLNHFILGYIKAIKLNNL